MGARVMTVLGPIVPEELGATLPHEHLIVDLRHSVMGFDAILDDVDLAIEEIRAFKEAGGGTVVDVTNACMGRDAQALKRISSESGVHIVTSTGYYTEPYYPAEVYELSTNKLAQLMVTELTTGIDGTDIKAGIIAEIGTRRDFVNPAEERVFRAAARAHLSTGAAISTHTYIEQLLQDQLDILEDEGVDLSRVIIGHLGNYRDMDRLRAVADRGAYLQLDHIGFEVNQRDHQRAKTIAHLVEEGYLSQILISMDICTKSRLHWYGGTGYDHLLKGFKPLLTAAGVSSEALEVMMIKNPQRALAFDS